MYSTCLPYFHVTHFRPAVLTSRHLPQLNHHACCRRRPCYSKINFLIGGSTITQIQSIKEMLKKN